MPKKFVVLGLHNDAGTKRNLRKWHAIEKRLRDGKELHQR